MSKRKIYILEDSDIAFSACLLSEPSLNKSFCIKPKISYQDNFKNYYECGYGGIHLHCKQHLSTSLRQKNADGDFTGEIVWWCDKCAVADENYKGVTINKNEIDERARIYIESQENEFEIIRVDEHYKEIIIEKEKNKTPYFYAGKIETDIHGKTQIHLYVGKTGERRKVHYFIEPENARIRYEIGGKNYNVDPSEIVSEITIKMKDRLLSHTYGEKENE